MQGSEAETNDGAHETPVNRLMNAAGSLAGALIHIWVDNPILTGLLGILLVFAGLIGVIGSVSAHAEPLNCSSQPRATYRHGRVGKSDMANPHAFRNQKSKLRGGGKAH